MPCTVTRDEHGACYIVPAFTPKLKTNLKVLIPRPQVEVFWDRDFTQKSLEDLLIRQVNGEKADVISITAGQGYDLLHALMCALKDI